MDKIVEILTTMRNECEQLAMQDGMGESEIKRYAQAIRDIDPWIPVSEGLPEDDEIRRTFLILFGRREVRALGAALYSDLAKEIQNINDYYGAVTHRKVDVLPEQPRIPL